MHIIWYERLVSLAVHKHRRDPIHHLLRFQVRIYVKALVDVNVKTNHGGLRALRKKGLYAVMYPFAWPAPVRTELDHDVTWVDLQHIHECVSGFDLAYDLSGCWRGLLHYQWYVIAYVSRPVAGDARTTNRELQKQTKHRGYGMHAKEEVGYIVLPKVVM